jgi:protein gp37
MENSSIEWTDHTFNPWIGCAKVNTLCEHCYAWVLMDVRYGRVEWGPNGTRTRTSADNWKKPISWNRKAAKLGTRYRIFCASLADVFEDRDDLVPWRRDLIALIDKTPHLDWLLLTKRPELIPRFWERPATSCLFDDSLYRPNVWLGTSVGTQETADECVPHLVQARHLAPILFLSCEPLLEPVRLPLLSEVDWVIVGGESGAGARPMEETWVLDVKRDCDAAGSAFFFKQWGGVQKSRLGRSLLGRTWDAIPSPTAASRRNETVKAL